MLGLSPQEQNAIMGLRQKQQQIENKTINDLIQMAESARTAQSVQQRHKETMGLKREKYDHELEMDKIKNVFETKKTLISQSNADAATKNAETRRLAYQAKQEVDDATIEYKESQGFTTEVFEDSPGVFNTYFVKGGKKIGEPVRSSTTKDLGKSDKGTAKTVYQIQKELDEITLDEDNNHIYPTIDNLNSVKNYANELGKDITVLEFPITYEGFDTKPMRIPFIVDDVGENIKTSRILDVLVNKYNVSEKKANQMIDGFLELDDSERIINFGE